MSSNLLNPGTRLPDGSVVERLLAQGTALEHYVGSHTEFGHVLAHVVRPEGQAAWRALDDVLTSLGGVDVGQMEAHLGRGTVAGTQYLLTRAVLGKPLVRWLEASGAQSAENSLRLLRQAATIIGSMHGVTAHGALSELDIVIDRSRKLWITGAGYRRVELCTVGSSSPPFSLLASLAPELLDDPWSASEASDFFGLGYLLVCLLAGFCPTRVDIDATIDQLTETQPPGLIGLMEVLLDPSPALRVTSADEIIQRVDSALESLGLTPGSVLAVDPFAGLDLPPALQSSDPSEHERWIVRRDGRDWGPFTRTAILEQLQRDEIDENTPILDTHLRDLQPLGRIAEFQKDVAAYLPVRLDKEMKRQERRQEVVRGVKRTSTTAVVATILGFVTVGYIGYLNASMVTPMNFSEVQGQFAHVVPPPQIEYQGIAADDALLAALFDFSDPEAAPAGPSGRRRAGPRAADGNGAGAEAEDELIPDDGGDYVVDFSSDAPSTTLTSEQITAAVSENLFRVRDCYADEMGSNPGFRGVVASWSIRPDGRAFNVRIVDAGNGGNRVQQCVSRAIRRIRFGTFNNVPMNVRFPLTMN